MKDILEAVYTLVSSAVTNGVYVCIGSLPTKEGISVAVANGSPNSIYRQKQALNVTNIVINAKFKKQESAIDELCKIHKALNKKVNYPSDDYWQIANIETTNEPSYLGQEGNEWYLYGSSIVVRWYDGEKATFYPS